MNELKTAAVVPQSVSSWQCEIMFFTRKINTIELFKQNSSFKKVLFDGMVLGRYLSKNT